MKNRAFTLIELLAVIVILAIVALISVLQIIKVLNRSKLSATEDTVYGIIASAENYYALNLMDNTSKKKEFECNGTSCVLTKIDDYNYYGKEVILDFKGTIPQSGKIIISDIGTISVQNLKIDNFICNNENEKVTCEDSSIVNKLSLLDIPYKDKMTYYFDYNSLKNENIENYGDGDVKINAVNAKVDNDSIYFTGQDKSYAYTEDNLGKNDFFTIYFVSKFDNVYSNNYLISTTSNSNNRFGLGIGRYGTGTNGRNVILDMVSDVSESGITEYDILNYYVHTIVYNNGIASFYINGELTSQLSNCDTTSKFYFASYNNNGNIYGGSLIRFKQFAFVDEAQTEAQIKSNSTWLYNEFLKN